MTPETLPPDVSVTRKARQVSVTAQDAGQRLDRFLSRELPNVPRTRLFRLIRKGEVRINGKRADASARLQADDVVRVPPVRDAVPPAVAAEGAEAPRAPRPVPPRLAAGIRSAVIHEDAELIVLDKPAGLAVHGGSGISHGAIEALRAAYPDDELELVHRLDRDTSGILLVARKRSVLRTLHALLREHQFEKRYLALVAGHWNLGKQRIDVPLRTDIRVGGERTVRAHASGKESVSDFRPVQSFGRTATLMEVSIRTGRTHQIRVHAAHAGHPVAGDEKYGDEPFNETIKAAGLRRMFLHASSVSFVWPDRGTEFSVNTPLPPELAAVIDRLTGQRTQRRAAPPRARSGAIRSAPSGRRSPPRRKG